MTLFLLPAVFHLKLQKLYIFAKFGEKVGEAKAAHETSSEKKKHLKMAKKAVLNMYPSTFPGFATEILFWIGSNILRAVDRAEIGSS